MIGPALSRAPTRPAFARRCFSISASLFLSTVSISIIAQDRPGPITPDFSEFRIITERNIFNPNRTTRAERTESRPRPRPAQIETFTLVGTLGDGEQWTAFFDGSRSELRGRLRLHDTIGDFTLSAISNSGVQLQNGTNTLELRVGMQIRRDNDAPWYIAEQRTEAVTGRTAASRQSSTSKPPTGTDANDDEVLARLRQQRERELQ